MIGLASVASSLARSIRPAEGLIVKALGLAVVAGAAAAIPAAVRKADRAFKAPAPGGMG